MMAENETTQAAAAAESDNDNARPLLDPRLLMAARRGDSDLLKELLQLKKKHEEHAHGSMVEAAAAAASEVVIVDVVPHRRRSPAPAAAAAPTPSPPPTSSVPAASASPPPVDGVTLEGDTLLHVVAACGDDEDFLNCAKMTVHEYGHKHGDTPLRCAAAAGNANMISCLVDALAANVAAVADLVANTADDVEAAAAVKKAFLRMQNEVGETALHQAVRAANNKVACIDQLMAMDLELACIPRDDEDGASPLYLAISLGEVEIAQHLHSKSKGKLSCSGPDGRNVLHAAVHRGQALPMVLKWLKDMKPKDEDSSSVPLVWWLSSQRDRKQKGSTPLHLAASLEGWPDARFHFTRFPQVMLLSMSTAALLLDANLSTAYQADDDGGYPIHVAAHAGSLGVVKMLLERCPDCATLRDGEGH